jgi:hypothetical protein
LPFLGLEGKPEGRGLESRVCHSATPASLDKQAAREEFTKGHLKLGAKSNTGARLAEMPRC